MQFRQQMPPTGLTIDGPGQAENQVLGAVQQREGDSDQHLILWVEAQVLHEVPAQLPGPGEVPAGLRCRQMWNWKAACTVDSKR